MGKHLFYINVFDQVSEKSKFKKMERKVKFKKVYDLNKTIWVKRLNDCSNI